MDGRLIAILVILVISMLIGFPVWGVSLYLQAMLWATLTTFLLFSRCLLLVIPLGIGILSTGWSFLLAGITGFLILIIVFIED
jgi:hypothetical protein